jgi:uncharacterized protein YjbK
LIEKELKYKLNKNTYRKILTLLKNRDQIKYSQENYYFDHPKFKLRKNKFMLRVRKVNNTKSFLTVKYPKKLKKKLRPGLKVRVEHEVAIPLKIARKIIENKIALADLNIKPIRILKNTFSKADINKIQALGKLETQRTVIHFKKWLILEIDQSQVFNKKFYELEVETIDPEKADRFIHKFLKSQKIPCEYALQSKFSRFLQESRLAR